MRHGSLRLSSYACYCFLQALQSSIQRTHPIQCMYILPVTGYKTAIKLFSQPLILKKEGYQASIKYIPIPLILTSLFTTAVPTTSWISGYAYPMAWDLELYLRLSSCLGMAIGRLMLLCVMPKAEYACCHNL